MRLLACLAAGRHNQGHFPVRGLSTRNYPVPFAPEVRMRRSRLASHSPIPVRAWLAAALLVAAAAPAVWSQVPVAAVPAKDPVDSEVAAAQLIDQALIAEVKDHAEIMANLTYLSDVIGP